MVRDYVHRSGRRCAISFWKSTDVPRSEPNANSSRVLRGTTLVFCSAIVAFVLGAPTMVAAQDQPVNPVLAAGGQCRIQITEVARLGSLSDPASLIDPALVDVASLPDESGWVVADDAGNAAHFYERAGNFVGAFVSSGEGPGEIRRPTRVVRDRTDSLWVSQPQRRSVVVGARGDGRTIVSPEQ